MANGFNIRLSVWFETNKGAMKKDNAGFRLLLALAAAGIILAMLQDYYSR
jgi:hypothetical protein